MRGTISPFTQYAFMAWYSVKEKAQEQLYLYLYLYRQKSKRKSPHFSSLKDKIK